ncbi:major facilitator superfamily domain-containing protein [Zychaea mexicana]|uniref:major facilitator superfamily domain-containing protein n=1 Tax=Zychaea mexicana TaxID=64656 RepID=UPI0022FE0747|nr:major facilitator superfamily domain-containing protein [Zychaea mexicana]KAI9499295.1 major facilitator superfamily domain-containing protein [Zychaea mexicana]
MKVVETTIASSNQLAEEFDAKGERIYVKSDAEKKLVRKLDYVYVMPFVAILNFLQFFDKSTLNYAGVLGIQEDTNTSGSQFSWLGSLFYLGYLVYQVPNQFLLQRLPLTKYIGGLIVLWGLVLAVTFEAKNFPQLAGLRFLLGFFEAAMYPCCIMLISTMYRRREQASRLGAVYICNGVAMAVGGFIGYGVGHMDGALGHASWQWLMIILGVITIFFGFVIFFFLVDDPRSKFLRLTPEQLQIVDERQRDNTTVRTKEIKWHHVKEALTEPRFYCFCFASMLINFQNGALNTFSSIITAGFGFSGVDAILLSVPSGVVDIIYIVVIIWYNNKYGNTLYCACAMLVCAIIGLVLLIAIPVPKAKLLGLYLCWAYAAAYVMFLSSVANNVNGYTKKIFYSTSIIVFYTIGNFAGPLMMVAWQAPLYLGGMLAYIASNAICIVLFLIARMSMARLNRERMARGITSTATGEMQDLTDKEDPNFIYRL